MIKVFSLKSKSFNKCMAFTVPNFKENAAIIVTMNICNCDKDIIINTS